MVKKILLFIAVILVLAAASFLILLKNAGAFRTVEEEPLEVIRQTELFGPEDFEISYADSFAIISSTERKIYPPEEEEFGNLYFLDLKHGQDTHPVNLTDHLSFPFSPHGLSLFKLDSTYVVRVISHANNSHSVEEFELFNRDSLVHRQTLTDSSMIAPNNIVQTSPSSFYFTNDMYHSAGLGLFLEEFIGIGFSSVIYFDGNIYRAVADGIAFANGINIHRDKNLLLVGSSRGFKVHVFSIQESGNLVEKEIIQMPMGVDNIAVDSYSNFWISGHPNLLVYQEYSQRKIPISPSEVVKLSIKEETTEQQSIFVDDGEIISGSTIACPFDDLLLIGSALDNKLVLAKLKESSSRSINDNKNDP